MEAIDREDEHELRNQRRAEREEYLAKGKAVAERFDDVQAVADAAGGDRLILTPLARLKLTPSVFEISRSGQTRLFGSYCDFFPFFCFIDSRNR
jgi:hypothetical protein